VLKCFRLGRPLPPLTCQVAVNALRVRIDSHGRYPLALFCLTTAGFRPSAHRPPIRERRYMNYTSRAVTQGMASSKFAAGSRRVPSPRSPTGFSRFHCPYFVGTAGSDAFMTWYSTWPAPGPSAALAGAQSRRLRRTDRSQSVNRLPLPAAGNRNEGRQMIVPTTACQPARR
jgi:hypothetical protein